MVEENGLNLGNPYTAPMGKGFLKFGREEKKELDDLFFARLKGKK